DALAPPLQSPPAPWRFSLALHDALPIWRTTGSGLAALSAAQPLWRSANNREAPAGNLPRRATHRHCRELFAFRSHEGPARRFGRSEEHTSELQSHLNLVCRLLLETKNTA